MALTNDLRHRLTVFNKHQIENDIGHLATVPHP